MRLSDLQKIVIRQDPVWKYTLQYLIKVGGRLFVWDFFNPRD